MLAATRSRLAVMAAALLFSTGGAAIKLTALPWAQVAGLRAGIAALFLLVVLRVHWRSFGLASLAIGSAQAATMLLFVTGNKLTTAANVIFLQSTAPLYVLLLGPLLLGERRQRGDLGFLVLFALGLALFFVGQPPPQATAPDPLLGNLLSLASGLSWAATVLGMRSLALRQHAAARARVASAEGLVASPDRDLVSAATVLGNLLVFAICLPAIAAAPLPAGRDLALLGWLGIFQVGLAYALFTRGVRGVRAFDATLLTLIEPVLNPVWTWLVHGETAGPFAIAGGVVILGTSVARAWWVSSSRAARSAGLSEPL
ncbi:DMT family transporter [Candidatus Binatia bacterium]|jgi:drug/metabolite transporter (DMT)-like permease|nr:DMT family transporter [Candidatus Binatia bacterium]